MCPQKLWQQVHGCFRLQQAASNRHAYSYTSCARRSVHFVRAGSTINVKASVRWATGKRLTNRLPKLSLIILLYCSLGYYSVTSVIYYQEHTSCVMKNMYNCEWLCVYVSGIVCRE